MSKTEIPELQQLEFATDAGFGQRAKLGLVLLETDQTLEIEARLINLPGVDWYHSRIPMEPEVTPETLTAMEQALPIAAGLLPQEFAFDAIGYGCTSAATLIGEDGVTAAVHTAHPEVQVATPITAAVAAFKALGARRVAVVTPYTADVTEPIAAFFHANDLEVAALGSFCESSDLVVARITEASVEAGVRSMVAHAETLGGCDAVFVSCTSLRAFSVIDRLESEIGVPVVSSNSALLWHLLRLAGVDDQIDNLGALFLR